MNDPRMVRADPSEALVATYRRVQVRMQGLPIVNLALDVEAVDFAPWQGHWLGVMLTPWFMNLVLAPRELAAWTPLEPGGKRRYRFPAGDYEFIGADEPGIGEFQTCSLFSPVLEFDDQASARLVAQCARAALLDPANREPSASAAAPGPLAERLEAPMSRRDVLRARFLAASDDDRR